MANVFSVASKSICKMITVIDRVSDIALNITDAGLAGSEILKEQVEGYRDTERELIAAKLVMTKQKMAKLQAEGKALTRDNLDEIELLSMTPFVESYFLYTVKLHIHIHLR